MLEEHKETQAFHWPGAIVHSLHIPQYVRAKSALEQQSPQSPGARFKNRTNKHQKLERKPI